jgi:hypothetical protein
MLRTSDEERQRKKLRKALLRDLPEDPKAAIVSVLERLAENSAILNAYYRLDAEKEVGNWIPYSDSSLLLALVLDVELINSIDGCRQLVEKTEVSDHWRLLGKLLEKLTLQAESLAGMSSLFDVLYLAFLMLSNTFLGKGALEGLDETLFETEDAGSFGPLVSSLVDESKSDSERLSSLRMSLTSVVGGGLLGSEVPSVRP